MIGTIYAQEDLSAIPEDDIVFFLAGPTNPNYSWRTDLVSKVSNISIKSNIWFLIPESRKFPGVSSGIGNKVVSYETYNREFYRKMRMEGMSHDAINQIQWETYGLERGYVIYNMCQHWRLDIHDGRHGNISPTGRMEVHPQYCDRNLWIYYNNLEGDRSLNGDTVVLGGEAPGDNIGWLVWWIVKRDLHYARSVSSLISLICRFSD